jgi:hypothetical protein
LEWHFGAIVAIRPAVIAYDGAVPPHPPGAAAE